MDINRMRYFYTIAESGSMRKASEILNISAPALSKATKLLEEELGLKLIIQDGRSIRLTDEGQLFAKRSYEILQDLSKLKEEVTGNKDKHLPIRIATFEVFSTYFLSFLDRVDWGEKELLLHEMNPGELEQAIVDKHVDIGITYLPVPHPDLGFLKIKSIEMGVFTGAKAFKNVAQNDLPFVVPIIPITGNPSRVRGLDGWPDDAYPRNIKYRVTLMESALELCRQGKAAGYFPAFIVEEHNKKFKSSYQLMRRPSPYKGRVCKTDVFIVKRKSDLESKTIKQLAKGIRLTCF